MGPTSYRWWRMPVLAWRRSRSRSAARSCVSGLGSIIRVVPTQDTLPEDVAARRALVLTAWVERDAEPTEKGRLIEERDQLAGQNDRLRHLIRQLQPMQFGRRSEKLDPDQLNLALEDLEQAVAQGEAERERPIPRYAKPARKNGVLVAVHPASSRPSSV